jgi:hypothetical protein
VEPEDLAQGREIVLIRPVEVELEEAAAREQLGDRVSAEVHLGAAAIVDDAAGPRRAAFGGWSLCLGPLVRERRLARVARRRVLSHQPIVLLTTRHAGAANPS